MRTAAWSLVPLLALALPTGSAMELLPWADWAVDAAADQAAGPAPSPDARLDLRRLEVAADGLRLHLRLNGGPPELPPPVPAGTAVPADGLRLTLSGRIGPVDGEPTAFEVAGDGARLAFRVGGADLPASDQGFAEGSTASAFQGWVLLRHLAGPHPGNLTLPGVKATLESAAGSDTMEGGILHLYRTRLGGYSPSPVPPGGGFDEVEGPDFGGGPSVAIAPDGRIHVLHYVYRAERGAEVGIHHATVDGGWRSEKVAPFQPEKDLHYDAASRTRLAAAPDGSLHGLFAPCPGQACGKTWAYATDAGGAWAVTEPFSGLPAGNSHRDVPDIAVAGDRVVAAIPLTGDAVALVERDGGSWKELRRFEQARLPKLAVAPDGGIHLSWFRLVAGRHDQVDAGAVMHAAERGGWAETEVVEGVVDQTGFWKDSEVDGSFDMAVDPSGTPCFAWDAWLRQDRSGLERGFGCLRGGEVVAEPAPLKPGHGNPQLVMRMAFDAAGNAHIASGYGGTDHYLVRTPDGRWSKEELDRNDAWDMAVSPGGVPVFAYTQPHGGTTVAVAARLGLGPEPALLPIAESREEGLPWAGPPGLAGAPAWGLAGALAALMLAALARRR